MTFRRRLTSGFTLIELLLVLVLLTLVVSAVVPNFRLFSVGRQSKYTATQFLSLTRYARTQAVSEGRVYRMNFEDSAFYLTVDNGAGLFVELPGEYGRKYPLQTGVTMALDITAKEEGGEVLDFKPDGQADPGLITFTSANGEPTQVVAEAPSDLYRVVDANAMVVRTGGGVR